MSSSGCSDDTSSMQYSLGQEFLTSNCCQCLCDNIGNISCDSNCGSSQCDQTSSDSGIIYVCITLQWFCYVVVYYIYILHGYICLCIIMQECLLVSRPFVTEIIIYIRHAD